MRILVVEDDPLLGDALQAGLSSAASSWTGSRMASRAEIALTHAAFAAVVLDLGLPRLDGLSCCARERAKGQRYPYSC